MLRFLLLTLTLCLGCTLAIGAAVAVGRTQPPSEAVRWFHMDDCEQPCLMGITWGKTSYSEAKARLAKGVVIPEYKLHELLEYSDLLVLRLSKVDDPNHRIEISIDFVNDIVHSIGIGSAGGALPLKIGNVSNLIGSVGCSQGADNYDGNGVIKDRYVRIFFVSNPYYYIYLEIDERPPINWDAGLWGVSILPKKDTDDPCGGLTWHGLK